MTPQSDGETRWAGSSTLRLHHQPKTHRSRSVARFKARQRGCNCRACRARPQL